MRAAHVERPHAGGQSERRAISDGHRLILIIERNDRENRPKHLILGDEGARLYVRKYGRRKKESVRQIRRISACPAVENLRSLGDSLCDHTLVLGELGARGDWPHLRGGIEGVADLDGGGALGEHLKRVVV